MITRCPNCHTRFKVTEGQLKLVEGQVRCGACLKVFSAPEHEVSSFKAELDSIPADPSDTRDEQLASQSDGCTPPSVTAAPSDTSPPDEPAAHPTLGDTHSEPVAPPLLPLVAEPLHLSQPEMERNPVVTAFLLLGSLLALALLLFQFIWFERAWLADYPQLQRTYTLLCQKVNCDLDSSAALSRIRNHGLHVQPHPRFADAMKVSIVLENTAPFAQPWPALELSFTDIKGRGVAQRVFQPAEYLDTNTLSAARMAPAQLMQIELELVAPGRRGVSYELSLLAPTRSH
jgi:predicted Zn finger-like uncharacterized protein